MAKSAAEDFSNGLAGIGAFAGFLWGGAIGYEDIDIGFWSGAITGMLMGAVGGKILGVAVNVALQVLFVVLGLALIGLRLSNLVGFFS